MRTLGTPGTLTIELLPTDLIREEAERLIREGGASGSWEVYEGIIALLGPPIGEFPNQTMTLEQARLRFLRPDREGKNTGIECDYRQFYATVTGLVEIR